MSSPAPLIFVVAGESSGDNLGGRLLAALKRLTGGHVRFAGIGGPAMTAQGLASLFPMRELALIGLAEILPHLPRLIRRLGDTVAAVRAAQPAVVVTIDSPGFNFRLAKRLRPLGIPVVHYVAPQLWAWKAERGHRLKHLIDRMLVLLPFEPAFFARFGVPCTFVGHPILESGADRGDAARFRANHRLAPVQPLIVLMPGSRAGEVRRLLPVFGAALARLALQFPGLAAAIPTVEATAAIVRDVVGPWPIGAIPVGTTADKFDAATAALTKSGTSTLELALAGVPMAVAYRVSALSAFLIRRWITVERVAMVNLLVDREVVPELLQDRCTPDAIAAALGPLIADAAARDAQRSGLAHAIAALGEREPPPSERAARAVLDTLRGKAAG
jgi:lipid-A-disaccharide synthase